MSAAELRKIKSQLAMLSYAERLAMNDEPLEKKHI